MEVQRNVMALILFPYIILTISLQSPYVYKTKIIPTVFLGWGDAMFSFMVFADLTLYLSIIQT